jgi:predicted dehydrogenase
MSNRIPRRALAPAAFSIVPRHVMGGVAGAAPSDKLNLAGVGVGGMGAEYLKGCATENVAAIADVDPKFVARIYERYPKAARYTDFRRMLEREKSIDAVVIGTPDHTHAVIARTAMDLGKHVYCAKPMTRTIAEARLLARLARDRKVATQMSVQSCASEEACATEEWVKAGAVGRVRDVHVWTDRPVWPQALARPEATPPMPEGLEWDLWLGPAPVRPYNPAYHPFIWRGWVDFGTGALGDMACHAFHIVFRALGLSAPTRVQASTSKAVVSSLEMVNGEPLLRPKNAKFPETFPAASIVTWDFPQARLHWYDGGLKPPAPSGQAWPSSGMLFVGEKGAMFSGFSGGPKLEGYTPPPPTVARSKGHYVEWIAACKGGPAANCEFGFASRVTETALLGVIAQRTGRALEWDAAAGRFTSDAEANLLINPPARESWSL